MKEERNATEGPGPPCTVTTGEMKSQLPHPSGPGRLPTSAPPPPVRSEQSGFAPRPPTPPQLPWGAHPHVACTSGRTRGWVQAGARRERRLAECPGQRAAAGRGQGVRASPGARGTVPPPDPLRSPRVRRRRRVVGPGPGEAPREQREGRAGRGRRGRRPPPGVQPSSARPLLSPGDGDGRGARGRAAWGSRAAGSSGCCSCSRPPAPGSCSPCTPRRWSRTRGPAPEPGRGCGARPAGGDAGCGPSSPEPQPGVGVAPSGPTASGGPRAPRLRARGPLLPPGGPVPRALRRNAF